MLARLAAVGATLAIAFALAAVSTAGAQGPDIQITQLGCDGDPELVVIENRGDTPQQLAAWRLQSDPPDAEVFDLSLLGGLQPGASVFIQSGPAASGIFKWGLEFVFRDGDPTDYARIVDAGGNVVHQVNCGTPLPTPTPAATPPDQVPNGGGPPPPPGGALPAVMVALIGGSMAILGAATITLPRFRRRRPPAAGPAPPQAEPASRPRARRWPDRRRRGPSLLALGLALLALAALVALLLLWRRGK